MTLASSTRYKSYSPVVSTDTFSVTFPIFDNDDLLVYIDGVLTTDYSVTATYSGGRSSDAEVVLNTAISSGLIEIYGDTPAQRDEDVGASSPNLARSLQNDMDRQTAVQQEQKRDAGASIRVPGGEASLALLPAAPLRANRWLYFDSNGALQVGTEAPSQAAASSFAATLLDDGSASDMLTTLGLSTYFKTLVSAADAGTLRNLTFTMLAQIGSYSGDVDDLKESQVRGIDNGATNIPSGATGNGDAMLVIEDDAANTLQVYFESTGRMHVRTQMSGVWQAWIGLPIQSEVDSAIATAVQNRNALPDALDASAGTETSLDFDDIPDWVTQITVTVRQVSTNGSSDMIIQLGHSSGTFVETGYTSGASQNDQRNTATKGFLLTFSVTGPTSITGGLTLTKDSNNNWVAFGAGGPGDV